MTVMPRTGPLDFTARLIATAGGAGHVPLMPGTAGALVGVGLFLAVASLGMGQFYFPGLVILTAAGVWAAGKVEAHYGHDAPVIVIDEVVGQLIALAPIGPWDGSMLLRVVAGFALFRFFDILKPFPIRRLEGFGGGFGVMADDIGAGVFALLGAQILGRLVEIP